MTDISEEVGHFLDPCNQERGLTSWIPVINFDCEPQISSNLTFELVVC